MFGKKRKAQEEIRSALQPPAKPPKRSFFARPSPAETRNAEITVQIDDMEPGCRCVVDTALSTHIGTREYQQDAAYVCEPLYEDGLAFGVLCDGMGGMDDGELASSEVVAFMANRIATLPDGADVADFFEKAVADANEMVLQHNSENGLESGTTLVSVILRGGQLFWASVGDSRIYILRGGEMARLTRDHNYALELQEMVEAGRITQQQADENPNREALVSYIGAPVLEIIDVNRGNFALQPGDILLLCSDGLTKSLPDARILQLVMQHAHDLREAARVLPLTAFDESPGGQDNTSVILMQYNGAAPAAPPA